MSVTFDDVRRIALTLENVEEGTSYGTPAFKVKGALFVRLKEDGETLVVRMSFDERTEMIETDPQVYSVTDHYLNYKWILVRTKRIELDALHDLLRGAWRMAAAEKTAQKKRSRSGQRRIAPKRSHKS